MRYFGNELYDGGLKNWCSINCSIRVLSEYMEHVFRLIIKQALTIAITGSAKKTMLNGYKSTSRLLFSKFFIRARREGNDDSLSAALAVVD